MQGPYDRWVARTRVSPRAALFIELVSAADLSADIGQRALTDAGVDPEGLVLLAFVRELEPVTQTELVRQRGVGRTTLRDRLQRLVERGDLERIPNIADRRSQLVRLTPAGLRRLEAGLPVLERAGERVEQVLSASVEPHLAWLEELARCFREILAEERTGGAAASEG